MSNIPRISNLPDRFSEFPGIRKNLIIYWYEKCKPSQEAIKICPWLEGYELQKLLTWFPIVKTYYEQKVCDARLAWALSECKESEERFDNAEKIRNMFCYCNNLREVFLEYKMSIENYLCTKSKKEDLNEILKHTEKNKKLEEENKKLEEEFKNLKEKIKKLEEGIKNFGNFVETSNESSDDKSKNKKWSFEKKEQEKCKFEYMEDEEEIKEMNNSIGIFSKFCEGVCRYIGVYKEIFENVI